MEDKNAFNKLRNNMDKCEKANELRKELKKADDLLKEAKKAAKLRKEILLNKSPN